MKKWIIIILALAVCVSLAACGKQQKETNNKSSVAVKESLTPESESEKKTTSGKVTSETKTETETTAAGSTDASASKTLVVYFSNTGNTKNIAEHIASGLKADTYEIIASVPYSSEDLNYNNDKSRSTQEMNDSSARPAISGSVSNWNQYDTIYIGYPIWWGEAPRILDTFVESYDFTGKTVVPFCTSSSSGLGSSAKTLESLAKNGTWKSGHRFSGKETQDAVMNWVNSL